eukprot:4725333-Amphidinium_carterae.1
MQLLSPKEDLANSIQIWVQSSFKQPPDVENQGLQVLGSRCMEPPQIHRKNEVDHVPQTVLPIQLRNMVDHTPQVPLDHAPRQIIHHKSLADHTAQ